MFNTKVTPPEARNFTAGNTNAIEDRRDLTRIEGGADKTPKSSVRT